MPDPSAPPSSSAERPRGRKRAWRWVQELGIVLMVLLGVRACQQRNLPTGRAPDWGPVTDLAGTPVRLEAFRGRPLMLHFWATWCGVCKAEQPNVAALAADVPVVTVASRSGPAGAVAAYLTEHPLEATVIADPAGRLAAHYGVGAYPTTFFVDGEGVIRHVEVGYTSELGMRLRMWFAGR